MKKTALVLGLLALLAGAALGAPVYSTYNLAQLGFANADTQDGCCDSNSTWYGIHGGRYMPNGNAGPYAVNFDALSSLSLPQYTAVPFNLSKSKNAVNSHLINPADDVVLDAWSGHEAANRGSGPASITIPTSLPNANAVFLLMNTLWGSTDPEKVQITFLFADNMEYTYKLEGGENVRDYNDGFWTNTIDGAGTVQVFSYTVPANEAGGETKNVRMDMLYLPIPHGFLGRPLLGIKVTDFGNPCSGFPCEASRIFLWGATVHYTPIPEPGTMALVGLGMLGLALARRRN